MALTILPEEQDIDIDGDDGGDYGRALAAHDQQQPTSECAEIGSCLLDRKCPHYSQCDDGDTIVRGLE